MHPWVLRGLASWGHSLSYLKDCGKGESFMGIEKATSLLSSRRGRKMGRAAVQPASLHYLGGVMHQSILEAISNHNKQNLAIGIGHPMFVKLKCLTNYSSVMKRLVQWTGGNQWKLFILISERFLTPSLMTLMTNSSFFSRFLLTLSKICIYRCAKILSTICRNV